VILAAYVRDGVYALNEARDVLGLSPVEGGDEPLFLTAQGPMLLRDAVSSRKEAGTPKTDGRSSASNVS
jgi:hypothetical protein